MALKSVGVLSKYVALKIVRPALLQADCVDLIQDALQDLLSTARMLKKEALPGIVCKWHTETVSGPSQAKCSSHARIEMLRGVHSSRCWKRMPGSKHQNKAARGHSETCTLSVTSKRAGAGLPEPKAKLERSESSDFPFSS